MVCLFCVAKFSDSNDMCNTHSKRLACDVVVIDLHWCTFFTKVHSLTHGKL